jgi:hypothetical protein
MEAKRTLACFIAVVIIGAAVVKVIAGFKRLKNFASREGVLQSSLPCFKGH